MIKFISIKNFILHNVIYRKYQIEYFNHLNKFFKKKSARKEKNLILLEFYPSWSSLISFAYLIYVLGKKHNAKTILYLPRRPNKLKIFYYNLLNKFNISHFNLLSIYSENNLLIPEFGKIDKYKYYISKLKNIKNKSDILKIKFEGILVGDLIYDGYLRKYNTYTIDPSSNQFREYYIYCSKLFVFWFEYIKNNKVKSLIASHTVYENAIPLRISYSLGAKDTFTSGLHYTYKHSKKFPTIDYDVKKRFNKLSKNEKKNALIISDKILKKKFRGGNTMDALQGEREVIIQKIKKSNNKSTNNNILIAIHSFSDAPHVFGNFVFEDQYEWLLFLAKESEKNKKFNWLLKVHPIYYDKEISFVHKILNNYPHIKILPKDVTNGELINKGIKFVLSIYGSITYEYAYFGVPSILASKNHPYKKYNFMRDASTKSQYKKILKSLNNLKIPVSRDEVLEYYFMRFVRVNKLFKNFSKVADTLGAGYTTPLLYKLWLKEFNIKKHNRIIKKLNSYICSEDYNFEYYD